MDQFITWGDSGTTIHVPPIPNGISLVVTLFAFGAGLTLLLWLLRNWNKRRAFGLAISNWARIAKRFFANAYLWILLPLAAALIVWALVSYVSQLPGILHDVLARLTSLLSDSATAGDYPTNTSIRNLGYTFAALAGALAVFATIPFQLIKVWVNERSTRTAEENLTTSLINQAVTGLGAQKEVNRLGRIVTYTKDGKPKELFQWHDEPHDLPDSDQDENGNLLREIKSVQSISQTVPNLEVRLGAIYALERIAQNSDRDHVRIMEILCAYIRENAPAWGAQKNELGPWPDYPEDPTPKELETYRKTLYLRESDRGTWVQDLKSNYAPRADIQAAIEVIGRRTPAQIALEQKRPHRQSDEAYRLDLRGVNLQAADLSNLNLKRTLLTAAHLEGANLSDAHLEGANLWNAHLEGANLGWAHLEGANLMWAHLEGADLVCAHLERANLMWAHLEKAILSYTHLEGADLKGTHLQGAFPNGAHLEGADLSYAHLEGADLSGAHFSATTFFNPASIRGAGLKDVDLTIPNTDPNQLPQLLAEAFGDASVVLPYGLTAGSAPLDDWSSVKLGQTEFRDAWYAYKRKTATTPPKS